MNGLRTRRLFGKHENGEVVLLENMEALSIPSLEKLQDDWWNRALRVLELVIERVHKFRVETNSKLRWYSTVPAYVQKLLRDNNEKVKKEDALRELADLGTFLYG